MRNFRQLVPYAIASVVMFFYARAIEESVIVMIWDGLFLVWGMKGIVQIICCRGGDHDHGHTFVLSLTEEWCVRRHCIRCDKEWFDPLSQALLPTGTHDEVARFDEEPRPASYSAKGWADVRELYVLRISIWYLKKLQEELEQGEEWKGES